MGASDSLTEALCSTALGAYQRLGVAWGPRFCLPGQGVATAGRSAGEPRGAHPKSGTVQSAGRAVHFFLGD